MSIPAVAGGRNLICNLARNPLRAFRNETEVATPAWMYRTNGGTSPFHRMLWTLDDLVFSGWSLWAVERSTAGQITDAARVPREWWNFDPDSFEIFVQGQTVTPESVLLIPGPHEGLLEMAETTIRAAVDLERAWAMRVRRPIPAVEVHSTDDTPRTDTEIHELVDSVNEVIDGGGGVFHTPSDIEVKSHGDTVLDLLVQGRNAVTLDFGRYLSVPGVKLDAALASASLQYSTAVDGRNEFVDTTARFWLTPIEARLSLDDVVPRGQRVAFDLSDMTDIPQTGQAPATED
ncbi:Phage portal protein [Jiangella alba]|uniref:Phage portal protein n=2 Tax=Jiangella alba TaxID=561176 RepID=A0A1H5PJC8_9ACTN|nr:Phage portal protein [Jiangella alba]